MKRNRQTTAAKAATNTNGGAKGAAKGNGYWRTTTRKGERVLIDPAGNVSHCTPEGTRDAALTPTAREGLAWSIKWARRYAKLLSEKPEEMREYVREKRLDAIQKDRTLDSHGKSIEIPADVFILLRAGARLVRDNFDAFLADMFQGELEALLEVAEGETGKREIPLTRHERAALERIRATRPQIEAEARARPAARATA